MPSPPRLRLRTRTVLWLASARQRLLNGQGGLGSRGPRVSFQNLHLGSGAKTGPSVGAGAGAGAVAYCTQNSFTAGTPATAAASLSAAAAAVPMAEEGPSTSASVPWWSRLTRWRQVSRPEGLAAEQRVLGLFPGNMQASDVRVGPGPQAFLHTLSGGPASVDPPVVMMPGYGAGVGFFYRNFPALTQRLRLFAVDWLGTGLSGRPPYKATSREQAEDFFLTSLATWRQAAGLDGTKMILVGHSLGGYLAANYALRYPGHVAHLVLVCPAGVPKAPEDWERSITGDKWSWRGQLFKTFMWGWEKGITPGSIIRGLGPWGQKLVYGYVSKRFSHHGEGLSEREIEGFKDYFYQIAAAPGSGEYALRHLLAPGAWAYSPLEERLHELKVPVTFIYGKHDWMRPEHAVKLCQRLRQERAPRCPSDLAVELIEDAGHFVFMDQPELFDKALMSVVRPYLRTPQQREGAAAYCAEGATAADLDQQPATLWGFAASGVQGQGEGRGPEGEGTEEAGGQEKPRVERKA